MSENGRRTGTRREIGEVTEDVGSAGKQRGKEHITESHHQLCRGRSPVVLLPLWPISEGHTDRLLRSSTYEISLNLFFKYILVKIKPISTAGQEEASSPQRRSHTSHQFLIVFFHQWLT